MKDIVLAFGVGEHDERLASLLDSMIERGTHPDAWVSAWMDAGARQELSDKPTLRVAVLFAEAVLRHMSMLMKDTVVDGKSVWAHMRLPDNYFPLLFRATGTRTELSELVNERLPRFNEDVPVVLGDATEVHADLLFLCCIYRCVCIIRTLHTTDHAFVRAVWAELFANAEWAFHFDAIVTRWWRDSP